MKKVLIVVLVLVFVALAFTAYAKQPVTPVTISTSAPKMETETRIVIDDAVLKEFQEKWPILNNSKQAKALGLRLTFLTEPVWAFNLLNKPKENPYELKQLPTGTKVWVDGNEIPRYKADCLNLIYVPTKLEFVSTIVTPATVTPPIVKKSFWAGFWDVFWDILKWTGIILSTLLFLLLLLCLLCLFRWPWRVARRLFGKDRPTPPVTPVTPVAPKIVWAIRGSGDVNGKIKFESDGFKHVSISSNKKPSIKAF